MRTGNHRKAINQVQLALQVIVDASPSEGYRAKCKTHARIFRRRKWWEKNRVIRSNGASKIIQQSDTGSAVPAVINPKVVTYARSDGPRCACRRGLRIDLLREENAQTRVRAYGNSPLNIFRGRVI